MSTSPTKAYYPLAGQREFMRLLGQYVAEGIDVFHPFSGRYGKLKGLPYSEWHQEAPVADVEFYCNEEDRAEGCGDITEPVDKILPVLRPFPQLCDELEDGTVPAVEVAKLVWPERQACWQLLKARHWTQSPYISAERECIHVTEPLGSGMSNLYLEIWTDWRIDVPKRNKGSNIVAAIDYLRSQHFAVNLKPHQFHPKPPGPRAQ